MRNAFSTTLVRSAQADPRRLLLTGDHGYALFDEFRKSRPEQFINAGVAEQNMVGVAAGLAKEGFLPVVYGLSSFIPIRVLEQIKIDVCYEELPVLFIGDGAGVVYSTLGSSHQSTEDLAALRALPHLTLLSPADPFEMQACLDFAFSLGKPAYLRMGKSDVGKIHANPIKLVGGELLPLTGRQGKMAIIATGSMVKTALELAPLLSGCTVWSAPFIKPLQEEGVVEICRNHSMIVTLEEHSIYGGLGSAIAEISSSFFPTPVLRLGIQDRFSKKCGSYAYLIREHGLNVEALLEPIEQFRKRHV